VEARRHRLARARRGADRRGRGGRRRGGAARAAPGLRRIPLERAAKRIDNSHGLHDRLGSALAFASEAAPTAFMQAAIDDARRAAAQVDVRRAAPLRRPRGLGVSLSLGTAALIVALLHFPSPEVEALVLPPRPPRLHVDAELLQPEREAVAQLEADAKESDDKDSQALAEDMKKLLQQLDAEELTRKQVFDKLAEIEKKLKGTDGDFEELKRALKQAGAELGKEKLTKEMGDALAKEDLATAKKELEKLAAEAEKLDAQRKEADKDKKDAKALKEKDREPLARSLDRAGREQQEKKTAEEKKREAEEKRLKEEERRLKKELAQKPNDKELERKLQRNQRQLERLEREKQQRAEQKRQLERLQRELQKAAEQLRQKLSPQAAEALRKAAQQMGQMENEIRKLGNMSKAQVQIAELKEVLRRAGQSQQGQGGQNGQGQDGQEGQDGQDGQNGKGAQGQNGKGRNGKGGQGSEKALLREFNDRAGGGQKTLLLGGKGGDGSVLLPLPGLGGGDKPGQDGQGGGKDPGDGIGDQHDPNLTGDKTQLAGKRNATRVQGKEGAGPSKSETILGSAEKGFATRNYRRVYSDYNSVVEEVMSKERVPPGYRYYIKRYFQLIRPRD
jgi:hypothetical protein